MTFLPPYTVPREEPSPLITIPPISHRRWEGLWRWWRRRYKYFPRPKRHTEAVGQSDPKAIRQRIFDYKGHLTIKAVTVAVEEALEEWKVKPVVAIVSTQKVSLALPQSPATI